MKPGDKVMFVGPVDEFTLDDNLVPMKVYRVLGVAPGGYCIKCPGVIKPVQCLSLGYDTAHWYSEELFILIQEEEKKL